MNRTPIFVIVFLLVHFLIYSGGAQDEPESQNFSTERLSNPIEELESELPETIIILETYPDTNIYNALGKNTVKSGFPSSIFNVFERLSETYNPIIVYWDFIPYSEVLSTYSVVDDITQDAEIDAVNQELVNYARDHIGLSHAYDILETYDPAMANILILVECGMQRNKVTEKISIIFYNFNYRLITPSDQIVIGKSKASLIRESYYDPLNKEISEKTLADIWY